MKTDVKRQRRHDDTSCSSNTQKRQEKPIKNDFSKDRKWSELLFFDIKLLLLCC